MDAAEIDLAIAEVDERLEKLRILYDQYFSGIERTEPLRRREELERRIKNLRRENIRNTGQRFKFQQIVQRYTTFSQYWTRILRQIEQGTFKRDLARAAKRFGTGPSSKRTEEAPRPDETEDLSTDLLEDEPEELDSSFIEEESDEDTSPFRRPASGPPVPAAARGAAPVSPPPPRAPAPSVPGALSTPSPALFAGDGPGERPAPASIPAPTPVRPISAPSPVSSAPAPVTPAAASSAPAVSSAPAPVTPAASSGTGTPAAPRRPMPAPTRLDLDDDDDLLGGGAPVRPLPRPAVAAPGAHPSGPLARPVSGATPGVAAPTSSPAAPAPASIPAPRTSGPTSTSAPRPPAPSVPQVTPAAASQGGSAPSMSGGEAPRSAPVPSTPRPSPERPVARVQPPAPRPTAEDLNDTRIRDIYNRYVEARRKCNESTAAITYDGLARSLRDSVPKLQQKHGGRVVDFEVVVKDGRTVLKPVVKGQ